MLHQITWSTFFIALMIVVMCYYLIIFIACYKKGATHRQIRQSEKTAKRAEDNAVASIGNIQAMQDQFSAYLTLNDEITAFLESVKIADNEQCKPDLLFSLVTIIRKYPQLKDTTYSAAISKTIREEYLQISNDVISEEELTGLWQS